MLRSKSGTTNKIQTTDDMERDSEGNATLEATQLSNTENWWESNELSRKAVKGTARARTRLVRGEDNPQRPFQTANPIEWNQHIRNTNEQRTYFRIKDDHVTSIETPKTMTQDSHTTVGHHPSKTSEDSKGEVSSNEGRPPSSLPDQPKQNSQFQLRPAHHLSPTFAKSPGTSAPKKKTVKAGAILLKQSTPDIIHFDTDDFAVANPLSPTDDSKRDALSKHAGSTSRTGSSPTKAEDFFAQFGL